MYFHSRCYVDGSVWSALRGVEGAAVAAVDVDFLCPRLTPPQHDVFKRNEMPFSLDHHTAKSGPHVLQGNASRVSTHLQVYIDYVLYIAIVGFCKVSISSST
jgi:hypothetical protein